MAHKISVEDCQALANDMSGRMKHTKDQELMQAQADVGAAATFLAQQLKRYELVQGNGDAS